MGGIYYTPKQIAGITAKIETVDPHLIGDGTYYVIEEAGLLVASGGWTTSAQFTLSDEASQPQPQLESATATIRAVFTAPSHARRGLTRKIMEHAENRSRNEGKAERIRLTATLSGLPFYEKLGYMIERPTSISLSNGGVFPAVQMSKTPKRNCLVAYDVCERSVA
ncbi:GNAT family N-acetyltransferase [Roseovarius arcticus]|uniref:GNAT family N-acetyltransferase n=1 Tax=Roseovarius arcticus TaxID=2547404 RepID=UPI0014865404|nr:GNAT family N-acetyltransferase [Roseovarius arcticus]